MLGSRELLHLAEPRAGFDVRGHCPGHEWELKLQRAAQDSWPGSEINPKQQAFHHRSGARAWHSISRHCPASPTHAGLSACGLGGSHQTWGSSGLSQPSSAGRMRALPRCPAAHMLPTLPALPARRQPAKVSHKRCPFSQKPITDFFSPPSGHGVPSTGGNGASLQLESSPMCVKRGRFITKLHQMKTVSLLFFPNGWK